MTQESSELFCFDIETKTWQLLKSKELHLNQEKEAMTGLGSFTDNYDIAVDEKESQSSRLTPRLAAVAKSNSKSSSKKKPRIKSANLNSTNSSRTLARMRQIQMNTVRDASSKYK